MLFERTQDYFSNYSEIRIKAVCCDKIFKYDLLLITVRIKWYHKFKFNVVSICVIPFLLLRQSVDSVIDQCADDKI
jgi:hypothetical protein